MFECQDIDACRVMLIKEDIDVPEGYLKESMYGLYLVTAPEAIEALRTGRASFLRREKDPYYRPSRVYKYSRRFDLTLRPSDKDIKSVFWYEEEGKDK